MPSRGSHEGIERLIDTDRWAGTHGEVSRSGDGVRLGGDGAARGYAPRRTLPLRVEIRRQWARRRTRLTLGFLVLLPFLLVAAFKLGSGSNRRGAPGFVDLATTGAANFTLFTVFAATGFLLVVIFALFAGDTVASEASWSSLRYLLAAPVPRSRLLWQKLLVALGFSLVALVLLPAVAYMVGGLFYGWAPARTPLGTTFSTGESLVRLGLVLAYVALTLLFVSALAFLLGVWTDAPLGAVGGAVLLVIVSNILDAIPALGDWRQVLPTHYQYSWTDLLGPTLVWDEVARGVLWSLAYSLVFFAAAWWHFLRKDIVS
jgi:ABC-2 type transport system permease protein